MSHVNDRGSRGSFTVEASLSLFLFTAAFLSLTLLVCVIRTESAVQYALDQTAKELAAYCYTAGRAGQLFGGFAGSGDDGVDPHSGGEAFLSAVEKLSSLSGGKGSETPEGFAGIMAEKLSGLGSGFSSISSAAEELYESFEPIAESPDGVLSALSGILAGGVIREAAGRAIAGPLCRLIMPGYLTDSGKNSSAEANARLEKWGIYGGLRGINFAFSSILKDGKSITLVAVYRLKLFDFGLFGGSIRVCQTASTAAWLPEPVIVDTGDSSPADSVWRLDNFARGKRIVADEKAKKPSMAVAGGAGIDLYDRSFPEYVSVVSVNIFNPTYSVFTPPPDDEETTTDCYSMNRKAILKEINESASKLKKSAGKLRPGDMIKMESGEELPAGGERTLLRLTVVVPEEGIRFSTLLESVGESCSGKYGIIVDYVFRDSAF